MSAVTGRDLQPIAERTRKRITRRLAPFLFLLQIPGTLLVELWSARRLIGICREAYTEVGLPV